MIWAYSMDAARPRDWAERPRHEDPDDYRQGEGFIAGRPRGACGRSPTAIGVVNLDVLTYSANLENVASVASHPNYAFEQADICDAEAVRAIFAKHRPDAVMHLAAESHNDRAIEGPLDFVRTNVMGTAILLEAARAHWNTLSDEAKAAFRFHHVSTDEVFGALGEDGDFTEETPYDPNSPYSSPARQRRPSGPRLGPHLLACRWC